MEIEQLENIISLVENGGELTLGPVGPVRCAAVATDEHSMLVAAVRRPNESISKLLGWVDSALIDAWDEVRYLVGRLIN